MSEEPHYKVCMLGDSGVGKTALVNIVSDNVFTEPHVATVGSQFIALPLEIGKDKITLEVWDTAGQEVYRALVGFYARDAKGAFLVCDVTDEKSFQSLDQWLTFVRESSSDVKVIVFANKIDLENERVVSSDAIKGWATSHEVEVIEGSAKQSRNTKEAFEKMGEMLLESGGGNAADTVDIQKGEDQGKRKKKCC